MMNGKSLFQFVGKPHKVKIRWKGNNGIYSFVNIFF